jgi:hypothetical protein
MERCTSGRLRGPSGVAGNGGVSAAVNVFMGAGSRAQCSRRAVTVSTKALERGRP